MNKAFKEALSARISKSLSDLDSFDGSSVSEIVESMDLEEYMDDFVADLSKVVVDEIDRCSFTFRLSGLQDPVYKQDMGEWESLSGNTMPTDDLLKSGRKVLPL